ncbi:hypothetical protein ACH5RR_021042 [Cinchona calisaya]|uniref:PHD-type domain-containing protein n=1 Tax=Cinchona calisaya TaxID=153742 RepID=A0ABD2ZHE5_9GENT
MANGDGNGNGNRNGNNGSGETVVSSIRVGMKREFAMMMKAQAECGIVLGQRRVTRSQISSSKAEERIRATTKEEKSNKKKKEDRNEVVKEEKKKVELVVVEEEEIKSDIVDGNSDDDRKKNLEKEGSDMGKVVVDEDGENEADLIKEPKDGIVGLVNEELVETREEKRDSGCGGEEVIGMVEVKDPVAAVSVGADVVSGNEAPPKTYVRRFTRSALKPKVEAVDAVEVVEKPEVEAEEQSGADGVKDEEAVQSDSVVSGPSSSKLEMKMSKKVELKKMPTKLKDLLDTGLLEGLTVRYMRGSRGSKSGDESLGGVIKGSGILCFCDDCKGTQVVTPNHFELHAGSGNKRPPEYIYLENGKSLRDILNVCKDASSDSLELAIQNAIGHSQAKPAFCLNCKEFVPQACPGGPVLCASCIASRDPEHKTTPSSDTSSRPSLPISGAKSSAKIASNSSPTKKGQGKLTKKDLRLHKLVFESSWLADGTPLGYYAQGKLLRSGYKLGSGIFCYCCNQVVSPSQFEAHAGCASRRKPYLQIYTPEGVSLHEWSLAIKRNMKPSTDESDDVCSICQGTGELLCCDMCPRAFHKVCVNLPSIPEGNWYCRYCVNMIQKEKFVERNVNAVAAGRVAGIDPVEEVKKRCVRIIGALEPEVGGCVLCRGHDFSKSDFGPLTVILCDQCEKEYHVGCLKDHGMDDLKELPNEKWFCCRECSSIHSALQQLIGEGEKELPDLMLSVIKQKHEDLGSEDNSELNISWRLLHGKMASEESRKLFSGAVSVFHDRFDPIGDSDKGRHDLIPIMIYGRSNKDQDFGGMYCAILTVNSIVVSAGIFRIFGQEVAEIPLVATSTTCQGKGYFQSLFGCIENLLASMNVRDLVLPAAPEAEAIWMNKFGFEKISAEQLEQYKKDYQMMIFQGTSVLHKGVAKLETSPS